MRDPQTRPGRPCARGAACALPDVSRQWTRWICASADEMPREEVLGRYAVVADAEAIAATYRPLVDDVGADIVAFQIASLDQEETIRMIGAEVLPQLRLVDWSSVCAKSSVVSRQS